jgi:hypothetical protein
MVRWVCKDCSITVDTKTMNVASQCYQGFACGEKGEASDQVALHTLWLRSRRASAGTAPPLRNPPPTSPLRWLSPHPGPGSRGGCIPLILPALLVRR